MNRFGTTVNPFRYVGRFGVQDEGNGLNYIRARYYIPELGRFITKDPLTGKDGNTQSLHRYVYALNNPVRLVDISGLSSKENNNIKMYSNTEMFFDSLKIIAEFGKIGLKKSAVEAYLNAIRLGNYSQLGAKILNKLRIANDATTVASLYLNINQEIESTTGSNIIKYWYETFSIGIQEDLKGLSTDDYLDSLALGLSSATAVSWNTATGLFNSVIKLSTKNKLDIELSGADIYQGTKYAVDNKLLPHLSGITDTLGNVFYQIGWY